jgi:hypothetical protein
VVFRAPVLESSLTSGQLGAPTGTVTFAVTGASGDVLTCSTGTNVITVSTTPKNQGLAKCVILAGQMTQSDGPYSVTATYSGDANYTSSSASLSEKVVG